MTKLHFCCHHKRSSPDGVDLHFTFVSAEGPLSFSLGSSLKLITINAQTAAKFKENEHYDLFFVPEHIVEQHESSPNTTQVSQPEQESAIDLESVEEPRESVEETPTKIESQPAST